MLEHVLEVDVRVALLLHILIWLNKHLLWWLSWVARWLVELLLAAEVSKLLVLKRRRYIGLLGNALLLKRLLLTWGDILVLLDNESRFYRVHIRLLRHKVHSRRGCDNRIMLCFGLSRFLLKFGQFKFELLWARCLVLPIVATDHVSSSKLAILAAIYSKRLLWVVWLLALSTSNNWMGAGEILILEEIKRYAASFLKLVSHLLVLN